MRIECEMNDATVHKACLLVNTYYCHPDFLESVAYNKYNMADAQEVSTRLYMTTAVFKVMGYKTFNPWSRVLGYYENNICYLNTRKLPRTLEDLTETIFHELLGHGLGYSHQGNRVTAFNLQTWPYKGAALFIKFLKSKKVL
jgi:hypothetical protein